MTELSPSKLRRLTELGRKRRAAVWEGYRNIGDYHGGAYDIDLVSPYSKSAGKIDAAVMVLLQDWASDGLLSGPLDDQIRDLGLKPSLATNRNLTRLLRHHFGLGLEEVFATNVFPFVKHGSMSANIPMKDLVRAAEEFALPQVLTVEPSVAICLGLRAFNAMRIAAGQGRATNLENAISSPFKLGTTQVWCQAHTGALGTNNRNRGGVDRVSEDWKRMAAFYRERMNEER